MERKSLSFHKFFLVSRKIELVIIIIFIMLSLRYNEYLRKLKDNSYEIVR